VRIAIIGAGISGLTAAYRLHPRHDVTVLEAGDYPGGHTNTIRFELDGRRHAVDTGFIVYNERNYPLFTQMLAELEVETQPTTMSFSVRSDRSGVEYNGTSTNALFAQRTNLLRPSFLRMVRDILRFNREAPTYEGVDGDSTTVGEYAEARGYSQRFLDEYLVPLGASLWSCPPKTFRRFPIRFVIEFLSNHSMLQVEGRPVWRVVSGGSYRYVEKLAALLGDRIRLNTPVARVERRPGDVRIVDASGSEGRFDHVVFACHSDQALRMLAQPTATERELLGAFPYQANEAILHMDASVLPKKRLAWAAWNYHIRRDDPDAVAVTYNMNRLQTLPEEPLFNVTLNHDDSIAEDRILRRIQYEHPIYTVDRRAAQARHAELIGPNRSSFCGAYWGYGFHEDGVRSAAAVCDVLAREQAA